MELRLPSGHITTIDDADRSLVGQYSLWAVPAPDTTYVATRVRFASGLRSILLHRVLTHVPSWLDVDHRNHDGLDNRRANLRVATESQNGANSRIRRNNTSGYKGVSWNKHAGKWTAYLMIDRRKYHLGCFNDPWEAAQSYNKAALTQWGAFALLNERTAQ